MHVLPGYLKSKELMWITNVLRIYFQLWMGVWRIVWSFFTKSVCHIVSVSVYYVAVRTIVLSRHWSNLARPVIIHDTIHSLMCMPSTPHCGFSVVSPDGNCAYVHWGSFTSNSKSVRRAIWFTWFSEPHDTTSLHDVLVYTAPGSPRRSPIQLWTGRDVA